MDYNSIRDLFRKLRPKPPTTYKIPPPPVITEEEENALVKLKQVFGKVCPRERRDLSTTELYDLYLERQTLDTLERLIKARKEAIRTTVVNAMDVRAEQKGIEPEVPQDKDGHYISPTALEVEGTHEVFSWEVAEGTPKINEARLAKLAASPEVEGFTQEDWLAITESVRVVSETKLLDLLKQRPDVLAYITDAIDEGTSRGSLYVRKHK